LTGDSGILELESEVKKDRTEAESESSDDGICCRADNRALVDDSETMEPESETDDDNPESESEMPRYRVCKGILLGLCLVMWVGSHLRADILLTAFPLLSFPSLHRHPV